MKSDNIRMAGVLFILAISVWVTWDTICLVTGRKQPTTTQQSTDVITHKWFENTSLNSFGVSKIHFDGKIYIVFQDSRGIFVIKDEPVSLLAAKRSETDSNK